MPDEVKPDPWANTAPDAPPAPSGAGTMVWDIQAGRPAYMPIEKLDEALASNNYREYGGTQGVTTTPGGAVIARNPRDLPAALKAGERPELLTGDLARAESEHRGQQFDTISDGIGVLVDGVVDMASMGLIHQHGENADIARSRHEFLHDVGGFTGVVLTGGLGEGSALKALGKATPLGMAERGAGAVAKGLIPEAAAGSRAEVLVKGARGALSNAAIMAGYDAGHQASDALIEDKPFSGEHIANQIPVGALLGGVLEAGSAALTRSVKREAAISALSAQDGLVNPESSLSKRVHGHFDEAIHAWDQVVDKRARELQILDGIQKDGKLVGVSDLVGPRKAALDAAISARKALDKFDLADIAAKGSGKDAANAAAALDAYGAAANRLDEVMAARTAEMANVARPKGIEVAPNPAEGFDRSLAGAEGRRAADWRGLGETEIPTGDETIQGVGSEPLRRAEAPGSRAVTPDEFAAFKAEREAFAAKAKESGPHLETGPETEEMAAEAAPDTEPQQARGPSEGFAPPDAATGNLRAPRAEAEPLAADTEQMPARPEAPPAIVEKLPAESKFVADLRQAVDQAEKFGPRKAFISSAWEHMPEAERGTLDEFKQRLLEAHRKGEVVLARADLVSAMDPELVAASEARHPAGAEFHFVDEIPPAKGAPGARVRLEDGRVVWRSEHRAMLKDYLRSLDAYEREARGGLAGDLKRSLKAPEPLPTAEQGAVTAEMRPPGQRPTEPLPGREPRTAERQAPEPEAPGQRPTREIPRRDTAVDEAAGALARADAAEAKAAKSKAKADLKAAEKARREADVAMDRAETHQMAREPAPDASTPGARVAHSDRDAFAFFANLGKDGRGPTPGHVAAAKVSAHLEALERLAQGRFTAAKALEVAESLGVPSVPRGPLAEKFVQLWALRRLADGAVAEARGVAKKSGLGHHLGKRAQAAMLGAAGFHMAGPLGAAIGASLGWSANLGSSIGRARKAIVGAAEKLLANGRARNLARTISYTSYTPPEGYSYNDGPPTIDLRQRVEQLHLAVADEEGTRGRIRKSMGDLAEVLPPEVVRGAEDITMNRLRNLSISAPTYLWVGAREISPGAQEERRFRELETATWQPQMLVDAVANGTMTAHLAQAMAMQHQEMQRVFTAELLKNPEAVRHMHPIALRQAELITGIPLTAGGDPAFVMRQQVIAPPGMEPQPAKAGKPQALKITAPPPTPSQAQGTAGRAPGN